MPDYPPSARRHYAQSALIAQRAAREALRARPRGLQAVTGVLLTHQVTQARQSERAVQAMLTEQDIDREADALLNSLTFTTSQSRLGLMLEGVSMEAEFARLVESLVQDAGRAAESVATAVRPNIGHVRYLNPPSCSRCTVLAGRVYRYSSGFLRHTNCDCVMVPTTVANPNLIQDPVDLMSRGLVAGLSKADRRAITDGADFGQVVNVRLKKAGLREPGRVLARAGRPTPEAIYRSTRTREEAVAALLDAGYIR